MKSKEIKSATVFVLIVLLIFGAMFFLQSENRVYLENGDHFVKTGKQKAYWIRTAEEGIQDFSFYCAPEETPLSILICRAKRFSLYTEEGTVEAIMKDQFTYMALVEIPASCYDEALCAYRISFEQEGWYWDPVSYIGRSEDLETLLNNYEFLTSAGVGILCVLLFYSFSLFICKPDERYLLSFTVYILAVLLFVQMNVVPVQRLVDFIPIQSRNHLIIGFVRYASIATCFYLLNTQDMGAARYISSWSGILGLSLIYWGLADGGHRNLCEYMYLFFQLYTVRMLIAASARGVPGARLMLCGFSTVFGFSLMTLLVNFNLLSSQLGYIVLCSVKASDLLFSSFCMLSINHRFAGKFRESEMLNRVLDEKVEERTRQYLEQREQRHNMMLNIFHDLRVPLFTLRGCTDIMAARFPEEKEILDVMQKRLHFVSSLTEDLFLLAKLEDGEMLLAGEKLDLTELVRQTGTAMQLKAREKNIELTVEAEENCRIWGNGENLERALQNLVSNALFYTDEGGEVCLLLKEEKENYKIRITDTGRGIRKEEQDRIFRKYYRAEPRKQDSSTGLGLSIAQNIVERHRGSISVESEYGKGSTFSVSLPKLVSKETLPPHDASL